MGVVKDVGDVVGGIGKAIANEPKGSEAIQYTAESAAVVMKTVRNVLLPLAVMNFAVDKAKRYFEQRFGEDMNQKLADIPGGRIIAPKASIAGPAIQGLAYSFEEDELRDLYLNLLASSMDELTADAAHPAYVEIIKQLTSREARMLRDLADDEGHLEWVYPIVDVHAEAGIDAGGGHSVVALNILDPARFNLTRTVPEINSAVDNWIRLGLFTVDSSSSISAAGAYDFAEQMEITVIRDAAAKRSMTVIFPRRILRTTAIGKNFFDTVSGNVDLG